MCAAALDRLRTIVQVPGHSSFAAAARAIYQGRDSALRQRIQGIEEAVGFRVIDRSTKPLVPTECGSKFLHEATDILKIADQAPGSSPDVLPSGNWSEGASPPISR
jgi:DNA-binding transcriptional LysR family regulator